MRYTRFALFGAIIFLMASLGFSQTADYNWSTGKGQYTLRIDFMNRPLQNVLVNAPTGLKYGQIKKIGNKLYTSKGTVDENHSSPGFDSYGRMKKALTFNTKKVNLKDSHFSAPTMAYVVIRVNGRDQTFFINSFAFQGILDGQTMQRTGTRQENFLFKKTAIPTGSRVKIYIPWPPERDATGEYLPVHVTIPGKPQNFFIQQESDVTIRRIGFLHYYVTGGPPWENVEFTPFSQDVWFNIRAFHKDVLRFNLVAVDRDGSDSDWAWLDIDKADAYLVYNGKNLPFARKLDAFQITPPQVAPTPTPTPTPTPVTGNAAIDITKKSNGDFHVAIDMPTPTAVFTGLPTNNIPYVILEYFILRGGPPWMEVYWDNFRGGNHEEFDIPKGEIRPGDFRFNLVVQTDPNSERDIWWANVHKVPTVRYNGRTIPIVKDANGDEAWQFTP